MKLKLDENVTIDAAGVLRAAGHDVDTVADERLVGAPDDQVMSAAQREYRMLVSFDVEFGDLRIHPVGSHAGVIVL